MLSYQCLPISKRIVVFARCLRLGQAVSNYSKASRRNSGALLDAAAMFELPVRLLSVSGNEDIVVCELEEYRRSDRFYDVVHVDIHFH